MWCARIVDQWIGFAHKEREYFYIFVALCHLNKELCVLCLFQIMIGITHFGIMNQPTTCQALNPTWTRTHSRVWVLG